MITHARSDVLDSDGNSAFGLYTPFMVVDRAGLSNHRNNDFQGELVDQSDNWKRPIRETSNVVALDSLFHGTF